MAGIKIHDTTHSWTAADGRKGTTQGPDFFSLVGTPFAPQGGPGAGPPNPYGGPPSGSGRGGYGGGYGGGGGGGYGGPHGGPHGGPPGGYGGASYAYGAPQYPAYPGPGGYPGGGHHAPPGPIGHGPLSNDQIMALLAQRESARIGRDYPRSDAMRDELRNAGVNVDDRDKTWRAADGRTGTIPRVN